MGMSLAECGVHRSSASLGGYWAPWTQVLWLVQSLGTAKASVVNATRAQAHGPRFPGRPP